MGVFGDREQASVGRSEELSQSRGGHWGRRPTHDKNVILAGAPQMITFGESPWISFSRCMQRYRLRSAKFRWNGSVRHWRSRTGVELFYARIAACGNRVLKVVVIGYGSIGRAAAARGRLVDTEALLAAARVSFCQRAGPRFRGGRAGEKHRFEMLKKP